MLKFCPLLALHYHNSYHLKMHLLLFNHISVQSIAPLTSFYPYLQQNENFIS